MDDLDAVSGASEEALDTDALESDDADEAPRNRASGRRGATAKAWSKSGRGESRESREPTHQMNSASEPPFADEAEDTSVRYSPAFGSTSEAPDHLGMIPRFDSGPPAAARRTSSLPPPGSKAPESPGDSTLSRYFRDMATHQVMGQEEELNAAQAVESAEIQLWVELMAYVPVAEYILDALDRDIQTLTDDIRPDTAALESLRQLCVVYRDQRSKLHANQLKQ